MTFSVYGCSVNAMKRNEQAASVTNRRPRIVGTGLIALDVVLDSSSELPSFIGVGGTCGNVLVILSMLGWDSYPVARLDESPVSNRIREDLAFWRVNLDFAFSSPSAESPVIIHRIKVDRHGDRYHRFSFNCPTCGSWLPNYKAVVNTVAKEVAEQIPEKGVFFFDRPSRASLTLAAATAAKGGVVVFEPVSVGDKKLFVEALSISHVLKYSDERFRTSPLDEASDDVVLLEVQTHGAQGLSYRRSTSMSREWVNLDALSAESVADTAGSGDWCSAGMIHKLCDGGLRSFKRKTNKEIKDALIFGQTLAAWNCQFEGARGGMYHLDEKAHSDKLSSIISDFELSDIERSFSQSLPYDNFQSVKFGCGGTMPLRGTCRS